MNWKPLISNSFLKTKNPLARISKILSICGMAVGCFSLIIALSVMNGFEDLAKTKLKGFQAGKVGPKDGDDFIGGNYVSALNIASTLPNVFPNSQNIDFSLFFDAANVWGVDYSSTIDDSSKIRSSVGMAVDWFTPIGPLTFSLTETLSKNTTDVTESFRFNIGTTF